MQISMLFIFYVLLAVLKLADELPSKSPGLSKALTAAAAKKSQTLLAKYLLTKENT